MTDWNVALHDDVLWRVQYYSERLKGWVVAPSTIDLRHLRGLYTYDGALAKRNKLRIANPWRSYRVHLYTNNPFRVIEGEIEVVRTSGDHEPAGVHEPGSYHYEPAPWGGVEAYDYGLAINGRLKLNELGNRLRAGRSVGQTVPRYRGRLVAECFGPFGYYIKNGVVRTGPFPDHDDHVHIAFVP